MTNDELRTFVQRNQGKQLEGTRVYIYIYPFVSVQNSYIVSGYKGYKNSKEHSKHLTYFLLF